MRLHLNYLLNDMQSIKLFACYCFLIFLGIFLIGCENPFRPDIHQQKKDYNYRDNSTPRNVLENLETAYNKQDFELYVNCLSESFRFELVSVEVDEIGIDIDGDGIKDSWWDYSQELEYHRNLFGKGSSDGSMPVPDNIFLNLQIPQENLWQYDKQEGRENWIIVPVYFDLKITIYGSSQLNADGYARFYLRPENDEWRIIIWRDESNI